MEELEFAASKILAEALNSSHNGQPPNSSESPSTIQPKKSEGAIKKKNPQSAKKKALNSATSNVAAECSPDVKASKGRRRSKKAENDKAANQSTDPGCSGTPKQKKNGQASCSNSSVFSDMSIKMNSADNLRNSKGNRRASVPNHNQELQGASGVSTVNSASKPIFHTPIPDKKNPKFRSKTPECPNAKTPQQQKKFTPKKCTKFEPYIPLFQVQQGLKRGEFIEGALRINPRNYEDAYLNSPDGKMDIYIGGMHDRNRALNGDIVAVQINPKQEWRVLCDAIKDYQEKSGEAVVETAYVPVSSPPCKVHTPDRLSRSRPQSSNSWGSSAASARLPDTLEILGVDKLAQQLEELSAAQSDSKRQRPKRKSKSNQQSKDSTSEKTSASYSQESSEDCLDQKSPMRFTQDLQDSSGTASNGKAGFAGVHTEKSLGASSTTANYHDSAYPACDMSEIGTFNMDVKQNSISLNPWESEGPALNIIVSPEDLLTVDGDSLLNQQITNNFIEIDNSENENDVIIVPPGELSGDEFTDSASIGSTPSEHLEQVLEDAAFLACQQDADNNNVELDNVYNQNVINQVSSTDFPSLYPAQGTVTTREKSVELECRVQHNQTLPVFQQVDVHSDSVICSGISQLSIAHSSSGENDESNSLTIEEFRAPDNLVNFSQLIPASNNISPPMITSEDNKIDIVPTLNNKKSRRRRRKKKQEEKKQVHQNDPNLNIISNDPKTWTVDEVMKHPEWPRFIQRTGKIVHILERKHSCIAAGHLKLLPDKNPKRALFSPNDSRVPRIMVPMSDCPPNFYHRHFDYANYLFLAQIVEWNETSTFAAGRLIKALGNSGDVEAQTEGILIENSVDYEEFPDAVLSCLPQEEFQIPKREIERRRDFRQECVFTIDPATARDMDDAVSCSRLDNGNFEVGVHIADVTYFVEPGTLLDKFAQERSTSVYLIQKVVPMLPRLLCDNLCSLTPNQDRLTFSVVWEMSPDGQICNQWIGRSIINSCVKLSYEHAQSMIENPANDCFSSEFPEVHGDFTLSDVSRRINDLQSLAVKLREKRFEEGALRLDQVKLQFTLDKESGLPSGYSLYVQRDSNKLIEEFMLLANMTVAEHIYKAFPSLSLLRRHPPPQAKLLQDTVAMCEAMGVVIDASSSATLQSSIAHYMGDDYMSKARTELLTSIFSKPMNCALYFCTGVLDEEPMFRHYALNVPLYTHFTSPIRRYPDIIVHRLLGASLKYNPPPNMRPNEMEICAAHCNDKKYNAKKVSEQSAEMFLAAFIREIGSVSAKAIIVGVMDHSFDCLILDMGIVKRVYCDKLPLVKKEFKRSHGVSRLNIFWKDPAFEKGLEQVIVIFALVDVELKVEKESLVIKATLKKPGLCDT